MTMGTMKGVEGIIKRIRRAGLKGRRTPECQREQKENRGQQKRSDSGA